MKGISYLENINGEREYAVLDLRVHAALLERLIEELNNPQVSPTPQDKPQTEDKQEGGQGDENASDRGGAGGADTAPRDAIVKTILDKAHTYLGTPHKMGGMDKSGIDCSGLMCVSFAEAGITLPRTSITQSEEGLVVHPLKTLPGDLLFFDTAKRGRINHVGLVVSNNAKNSVKFIHASTSKGVVVSDLAYKFWQRVFRKATRPLPV